MMRNHRCLGACRTIVLSLCAMASSFVAAPFLSGSTPQVSAATLAAAPGGAPNFIFAPYNATTKAVVRASFHYTVQPGSTITDSLVLANPTSYEQTFRIWSADAYNTALGGALALRLESYPMTQVGTWIKLPTGTADYGVSPGQEVVLHFALTVPPNAVPGDHVGGIEALDVTPPATGGSSRILVHEGIGVPIFINVPGPRHPSSSVTLVNTASSVPWLAFATGSSDARVGYQVENTGNTILRGKVQVSVTNIFGQTVKKFPSNVIGNLLPGAIAGYSEPLWRGLPIVGPQTVHVTFSPIGSKAATGSASFWVIPWLLIILILIALLALGYWLWRRHRKKTAEAAAAPDGTGVSGSGGVKEVQSEEPVPAG